MHHLFDILPLLHLAPFFLFGFWSNSGGNKSSSSTETLTSSGQNSPNASEGAQAVGSGSIGVSGTGAKYIEQGGTDLSGSQIGGVGGSLSASSGATVNIGDPQATQTIAALAQNFSDTVASLSGGSPSASVQSPAQGSLSSILSTQSLVIIGVIVLAIGGLVALFRGGKKT